MRSITLNAAKAGMTRLREKGGASPETLYELTNGYITASKAPRQRPGTRHMFKLPANTRGLCVHKGTFHTFSAVPMASGGAPGVEHSVFRYSKWMAGRLNLVMTVPPPIDFGVGDSVTLTVPPGHPLSQLNGGTFVVVDLPNLMMADIELPAGDTIPFGIDVDITPITLRKVGPGGGDYVVNCLRHPDAGYEGNLKAIHFAAPFLGHLYVVAEFEDGQVFHYYLKDPPGWRPDTGHMAGDLVQPTVPNGYYYQAAADVSPPAWEPLAKRALGDVVQPTTATGWKYTVTDVTGDNPASGSAEPDWPQTAGATVTEYGEAPPPKPPPGAPPTKPPPPGGGEYGGGGSPDEQPWKLPLYTTMIK